MDKKQLGSITAKGGFQNEVNISAKFNNYKFDHDAQRWLTKMGYNFERITQLISIKIPTRISEKIC